MVGWALTLLPTCGPSSAGCLNANLLAVATLGNGAAWIVGGDARGGLLGTASTGQVATYPLGLTSLEAVWASGLNEAWAVGDGGAAYHFTASAWTKVATATTADLSSLWGSGAKDVWIGVNDGSILHWNGTALAPLPLGMPVTHTFLWGSGPRDVWLAGYGVFHFDGNRWSGVTVPALAEEHGMWGSGPKDVWIVGSVDHLTAGAIHYDGTAFSLVTPKVPANSLTSIWGTSATDFWVGESGYPFLHSDGTTFTAASADAFSNGLSGSSASDIWSAGPLGQVWHYDGLQWTEGNTSWCAGVL